MQLSLGLALLSCATDVGWVCVLTEIKAAYHYYIIIIIIIIS